MLRESLCRSSDATSLPPTLHFPASLCLCVYYFNLKVRNSEVAGSRPRASICSSHQGQACSQAWGAEPQSPGGGRCEAECGEGGTILLVAHASGGPPPGVRGLFFSSPLVGGAWAQLSCYSQVLAAAHLHSRGAGPTRAVSCVSRPRLFVWCGGWIRIRKLLFASCVKHQLYTEFCKWYPLFGRAGSGGQTHCRPGLGRG